MRRLLIALVALIMVGLLAPTAWAHTTLLKGSPGPGDKVAPGSETVALKFADALDPDGEHVVAVLDASENPIKVSVPVVAEDHAVVCVRTAPLEAGVHEIRYNVTSEDGHAIASNYEFEVAEGGSSVELLGCDPSALGAADTEEKLADQDQSDFPAWAVWLLAGVAVLTAALAAVAIIRSRRESDDTQA